MTDRAHTKRQRIDEPLAVVRHFMAAINGADVDALAELLTKGHVLVDSLGYRVRGRQAVTRAWAGYFAMVPDYRIVARETVVSGRTVVVLGTAAGSYVSLDDTNHGKWQVPAAWRAVIQRGRIAEWQVYADNEPIRALMRNASKNAV